MTHTEARAWLLAHQADDIDPAAVALVDLVCREQERELARLAAQSECVPRAQCLNCGEFLSAVRVEMRLNSCALCAGKPRRKGRR